jgi:hypothetical protein
VARILVAEPDADVLGLVERALEGWGHEVVRFRPGAELPDVDVMIFEPGMGPRVLAVAGVLASASPPVPLVVASIYPPDPAVTELRPAARLLKPFSLGELEAAVAKALATGGRDA